MPVATSPCCSSWAAPRLLRRGLSLVLAAALVPACNRTGGTGDTGLSFAVYGDLDFGEIPEGTTGTRGLRVTVPGSSVPDIHGSFDGIETRWVEGDTGDHLLVVTCHPEELAVESGALVLEPSSLQRQVVTWTCSAGERPEHLPDPAAEEVGVQSYTSVDDSQLGDAELTAEDGARLFASPKTGDVFLTDPVKGRAWRQNQFYLVPSWGAWVANHMEEKGNWDSEPECFDNGVWNYQYGGCTGEERNLDGTIPDNFVYYHGGFIGDEGEIEGVRTGVALDEADLLVLAGERDGEGFMVVVDASYLDTLEDESTYSYLSLMRSVRGDLPEGLELVGDDDVAWAVEPATGRIFEVLALDTTTPEAQVTEDYRTDPVLAFGNTVEGGLLWTDEDLYRLDAEGLSSLGPCSAWGPLQDRVPTILAGDGTLVWAWFEGEQILAWRTEDGGDAGFLDTSGWSTVHDLVVDRVEGNDHASTAANAWLSADTEDGPALLAGLADEGVLETAGVPLPATPMEMGVDPWPDDIFLVYPAGEEGCDGDLAEHCEDGTHPTLIHTFFNPYGLHPPTATGHPLNIFMNPILETPKDHQVDTDFSKGNADCGDPPSEEEDPEMWDACCALAWALEARVQQNMDYFLESWATLGAGTESADDDLQLVIGVNPSWPRQAKNCFAQTGESKEHGFDALEILATYHDQGVAYTNWTHTSMADDNPDEAIAWYIGQLYREGVDWEAPMDSQAEYEMLHEGLAAAFDYDDLGYFSLPDGGEVRMSDLEVPFTTGAGNSFDGGAMLDPESGWPDDDPSWVRAVRDGPLATGEEPLGLFYFASAGGIPEVDLEEYRKKELLPIDTRERARLFEMGEDPEDWYRGGDAGIVYAPGSSWALSTIHGVAKSGLFRESLSWGLDVTEDHWEMVYRYVRRIIAASEADDVKSWYLHIFDISNTSGNFRQNSGVTEALDVNVQALDAINSRYVEPGYARWATPQEIYDEFVEAHGE